LRVSFENALSQVRLLLRKNFEVVVEVKNSGRGLYFLYRCTGFIKANFARARWACQSWDTFSNGLLTPR
jgi:hypothetical protein